jgi:hypothetical protein
MTDPRLSEGKDLARALHARLVSSEDLIYRIEDVLLAYRRRRTLVFFTFLNVVALILYLFVSLTYGLALFIILMLSLSRLSRKSMSWAVSAFLAPTVFVLPQTGPRRRFHVGQISAFIVSGWYFLRWSLDWARSAAERRDRSAIVIVITVLLTIFYLLWIIPDGILFWGLLDSIFLIPFAVERMVV